MVTLRHVAIALFAILSSACSPSTPGTLAYVLPTQMPIRTLTPVRAPPPNDATLAALVSQTFAVPLLGLPSATTESDSVQVSTTVTPESQPPVTATLFSGPLPLVDHFEDSPCGIAFDIPAGWQVTSYISELYPDARCSFGIRPNDWEMIVEQSEALLDDYPILVLAYGVPFGEAAFRAHFVRLDGDWFIEGRGIEEAQLVQADGRTILRGVAWYAVYTKANVSYAGLNTVTRVVLSDGGSSSVVVHTVYEPIGGTISLDEALELIVRTSTIPEVGD